MLYMFVCISVVVVVVVVVVGSPELTLQAERGGCGGPPYGVAGGAVVGALVLSRDVPQPQSSGGQRDRPGTQPPALQVPGDGRLWYA